MYASAHSSNVIVRALATTGSGTGRMSCSDGIVTVEQKTTRIGGTDASLRES